MTYFACLLASHCFSGRPTLVMNGKSGRTLDLRQYLQILGRWSWLIILAGVIAGVASYLVTASLPRIYQSTAVVLVNAPIRSTAQLTDTGLRTTERLLGTYAELLVSRPVLEQVARNVGLGGADSLRGLVTVEVEPNTLLVRVNVQNKSPELAAQIANEIPRVMNEQERDLLANPYVGAYREALNFVEVAQPNLSPILPRTNQTVMMAVLAVVALVVATAFLIEHLDDTVKTSEAVDDLVSLPTLATISRIRGGDFAGRLVTANNPRSRTAEAYRMFLAHLAFSEAERPIKTILVTSADRNEGKSTNIANLAVALAQTGKRVALIDMDLRGPVLHRFFKRTNQTGVTTALQRREGESLIEGNHLISSGIENLWLMPSGPLPTNPARLFGSSAITDLIVEVERQVDIVLIDSPAILAVVDATLIARHCDASLIVVRAKVTRSDRLRRTGELLAQSGTYVLGVILNNAPVGRNATYYADTSRGLLDRKQEVALSEGKAE